MVKEELNKRSPLRILENSIHGGVGKGNIGVLASRKGVGKTACLVHIATDKLLRGRQVIHISFSSKVDHIINWYNDIFKEIAKKRELESAIEIHNEIIKKRVIMNFTQNGLETAHVLKSIEVMINDGHFAADSVIFDGYDFQQASDDDLAAIRDFAKRINLEVWFSISLKGEEPLFDKQGIPGELKEYFKYLDVLIALKYEDNHVHLSVVKDHDNVDLKDMHLKLDPKTLLIALE